MPEALSRIPFRLKTMCPSPHLLKLNTYTPALVSNTISKTQRKHRAHQAQMLGVWLSDLPMSTLQQLELAQPLLDALQLTQKLRSHGAKRRHEQYLGRLMRTINTDQIVSLKAVLEQSKTQHNLHFQQIEQWRSRLLKSDAALNEWLNCYPTSDKIAIQNLVVKARREIEQQSTSKSSHALFRLIRNTIKND